MRALKILALFSSAAIGIYLGFYIEPTVLSVLYEHPLGYDTHVPFEYTRHLYQYHFFLIGVFTASLALACARLIHIPDLVALFVIALASIPYQPLFDLLRYGETINITVFRKVLWFQAPYFVGVLAVLGLVHLVSVVVLPHIRRRDS